MSQLESRGQSRPPRAGARDRPDAAYDRLLLVLRSLRSTRFIVTFGEIPTSRGRYRKFGIGSDRRLRSAQIRSSCPPIGGWSGAVHRACAKHRQGTASVLSSSSRQPRLAAGRHPSRTLQRRQRSLPKAPRLRSPRLLRDLAAWTWAVSLVDPAAARVRADPPSRGFCRCDLPPGRGHGDRPRCTRPRRPELPCPPENPASSSRMPCPSLQFAPRGCRSPGLCDTSIRHQ